MAVEMQGWWLEATMSQEYRNVERREFRVKALELDGGRVPGSSVTMEE